MNINEEELRQAALQTGLSSEQAQSLWQQLQTGSEVEAHFGAIHVGYYFGALLVIGAMGWFMTNGWDSFAGWQVSVIATGYAAVFFLAARWLWPQKLFRIPGGLLATIGVCMTPLAVFGLEKQFHLWPALDPGSYTRFHPYIDGSWVAMEAATVAVAALALRFFRFPFLTAPAAYALWFMSMDLSALIVGREWVWRERCMITAAFGVLMLMVSYWLDRRTEADYAFWGYLFGLMSFSGGLTFMDSGSEWGKLGYCAIHLALIVASLVLRRRVFLVFGALGVFSYLCGEAYGYFRNSVAFPFALSVIGIAVIAAAVMLKKNEAALQRRVDEWLPQSLRMAR
jgi:hypothetical protein